MEIALYTNDIEHPIAYFPSYASIELCNQAETKKLLMPLEKLSYGFEENYLNETYYQIILYLKLPDLDQDFLIEDLWINIFLVNDDHYTFSLGAFSLMAEKSNTSALEWNALDGKKNAQSYLSRLGTIEIEYQSLNKTVETILIGIEYAIDYVIEADKIVLTIPLENMLLDNVPIIIRFTDGTKQTISNFRYMIDYQILKESGMLIETYALN
ncbi:MAG: hypothetical protein ABH890_01105 [Bacillota bacterium]